MSEIILSSSSDSIDKAIDEYTDPSSFSGSSDSNNSGSGSGSSSEGNTTDEYESGVPGLPLEVVQEGLRTRSESGSKAGTSALSSTDKDEVEVVYSCAIGVVSKTDDRKNRDGNFSPPRLTRPSPLRPARVFPAPQRRWGRDGARF